MMAIQALLQGLDELGVVDLRLGLGDGHGVVVDALGDADDIELSSQMEAVRPMPDLPGFVLFGHRDGPGGLIVVAAVRIADDDVNVLGSGLGTPSG